jgi:hypothetical protein
MIRIGSVALLLAVLWPAVGHAQDRPRPPGDRPRAERQEARRAELEQQVTRQFVAQAAETLGLDSRQRDRLHGVLRAGAEERRELARQSRELRMELMRAVRTESTPNATYEGILARMSQLRQAERALERREEAALAQFLDARQRAQLLVLRMQLNERIRGMRGAPQGDRRGERPRGPGSQGGP